MVLLLSSTAAAVGEIVGAAVERKVEVESVQCSQINGLDGTAAGGFEPRTWK